MISQTRDSIMGMPITVRVIDSPATQKDIDDIFLFFQKVDNRFSTYKEDSEITKYNNHKISKKNLSAEMKHIFTLSEKTKRETHGYFDIKKPDGAIDPSGLVKGWAIWEASKLLTKKGFSHFYINAGGDIEAAGLTQHKSPWKVGIRNPFNRREIVKVLCLSNKGIATSGTYSRGQHIYNPYSSRKTLCKVLSLTVVGPNVYEADRFATAAFAMQEDGIDFIEKQKNLEGYMIDERGIATYTSGFEKFLC